MWTTKIIRTTSLVIFTAALLYADQAIKARGFSVGAIEKVASQKQEPAKKVLTAEDFPYYRVDQGLSREEATFVIEISPKLSPYVVRLAPDPASKWIGGQAQQVGRIEISRDGAHDLLQVIEVSTGADGSWFTKNFRAKDVNFDGYLDLMVLSDQGAKWGSFLYWLFDPESGRFITNKLTRQLGRLMANTYDWNPESRTLHLGFLNNDQARIGETYRIENGQLVLVEIEETQKDCDGNFQQVTVKIIDGKREGKDIVTLEPCKQITQDIAKGQAYYYELRLRAGQLLRIEFWGDVDLVMTLWDPDGDKRTVVESTSEGELRGLSWTAESSGIYRVEVRPMQGEPSSGRYYLTLEGTHLAHPKNN
jgi:hypothetical protein